MDSPHGPAAVRHNHANINGIRMHWVEAGAGEPVVLLHGFPEFWYSWRRQVEALAPEYRLIVPDQRGYNETEARGPYGVATLQADVAALLDHLGLERAHIVGHDWGGAIAWLLAMHHPERVASLAVLSMAHPLVFAAAVKRPPQCWRSWYMGMFQLPWLPERLLAARGYGRLARKMVSEAAPDTFTREDIEAHLESWRSHGLAGGLNWYRGLLRDPSPLPDPPPLVKAPALLIWGDRDPYLGPRLVHGTERHVARLEVRRLPEAGHWLQHEAHGQVNALLSRHFEQVAVHA